MENEIWKQTAIEGLEVSNLGRVRVAERVCTYVKNGKSETQIRKAKGISPYVSRGGYYEIAIKRNGERKKYRVHRLVAAAFCDGYADGLSVDHINGEKLDNRAVNLEWVPLKENTRRQWAIGLVDLRGENHPSHKLKQSQVRAIRRLLSLGAVANQIAEAVGVSASMIYKIQSGTRWAHL